MSITFTPGWVDITPYVRAGSKPIEINRGKQHELARIETSTMSLTVTSTDDRFNPKNTAGAYYPKVRPTTPIRVVSEYEGTDEHLWRGYVKGWPQKWTNSGKVSRIPLKCYDVFGIFARTEMRSYTAEVLKNSPLAFWLGDETAGIDLSGNGHDVSWNSAVSGITQYFYPILWNGPQAGPSTTAQWGTVTDNAAFRLAGNRSIEAWLWLDPANDGDGFATIVSDGEYLSGDPRLFQLKAKISGGDRITIGWGFNGVETSTLLDNRTTAIGRASAGSHWLHVVTTWNESEKRARLYINGEVVEDIFTSLAANVVTQILEIGRDALTQSEEYGSGTSANWWTSLAIYDHELQAGAVRSLYDHRIEPYRQGAAFIWWYYFPMIGWPVGDVLGVGDQRGYITHNDAGGAPGGAGQLSSPLDSTVFSEMRRIAESFNAEYYVDGQGRVVHYGVLDRARDFRTPVAVYTDDGTGLGYRVLVMPQDNTQIRNIWEVTPDGGATQRVLDQDSIDEHGPKTEKLAVTAYTKTNLRYKEQMIADKRARMGLAATKDPNTRVDRIVIQPGVDSGQWDAIFKLDLLRRVTVKRTPPGGSEESNDLVIQRMKYRIFLDALWTVELQLSPTENDDYWILGEDLLGIGTKLGW